MRKPVALLRLLSLTALTVVLIDTNVQAGVSPENVIVVVNGKSPASRTIANHYVESRQIPHGNVIVLPAVPEGLKVNLAAFKSRILLPILTEIDSRGIARQAQVIAYSADFPTSVDVRPHAQKLTDPTLKKYQRGTASLTGLTYFYRFVQADSATYLSLGSNLYARGPFQRYFINPFNGDDAAKFDQASQDFTSHPDKAAVAFHELAEAHPTLAPMWIRAAESALAAGNRESATKMLRGAIKAGWRSAEYLWQHESLSSLFRDPQLNRVSKQLDQAPIQLQLPASFSAQQSWTSCGFPTAAGKSGMQYMMSCSLAVLHERGSRLEQAVGALLRAAGSDHSFPDGEFMFADHGNVRSKTRVPGIEAAKELIEFRGYRSDIFNKPLPNRPGEFAGLMVGSATVNFSQQQWQLVPGAISENLTSYGGAFGNKGHTKATEFLHAGAAISSGTVTEPYALQQKFPRPQLYAYYASGCSAIEAYYLSLDSPYQLLIVGDPACQPFAKPPQHQVTFSQGDTPHQIRLQLSGSRETESENASKLTAIEIYLDGRLQRIVPPLGTVNMNLPKTRTGAVEVRAVLLGHESTVPRISHRQVISIAGDSTAPLATITRNRSTGRPNREGLANDGSKSKPITIKLQCPGADSIVVEHHGETIGTLDGDDGELKVATHQLGGGPLRMTPVAIFDGQRVEGVSVVDTH